MPFTQLNIKFKNAQRNTKIKGYSKHQNRNKERRFSCKPLIAI